MVCLYFVIESSNGSRYAYLLAYTDHRNMTIDIKNMEKNDSKFMYIYSGMVSYEINASHNEKPENPSTWFHINNWNIN